MISFTLIGKTTRGGWGGGYVNECYDTHSQTSKMLACSGLFFSIGLKTRSHGATFPFVQNLPEEPLVPYSGTWHHRHLCNLCTVNVINVCEFVYVCVCVCVCVCVVCGDIFRLKL